MTKDVLVRWEEVLDKLERDPQLLVRELDWVAKQHLIESYADRKGCGWDDPRVRLMDLQYHDVRPGKGLYYTLERSHMIERVVQDSEIVQAEFDSSLWNTRILPRAMHQQVCQIYLRSELDFRLV